MSTEIEHLEVEQPLLVLACTFPLLLTFSISRKAGTKRV